MNTGGPAFPQHGWTKDPEVLERMRNQGGMTLLDWFAGQALVSLSVFTAQQPHATVEDVAGDAYDLAEAMLAEKARREGVVKESQTTDHFPDATKKVENHPVWKAMEEWERKREQKSKEAKP